MITNDSNAKEKTVPAKFEMLKGPDSRTFLKIHTPGTSTIVEVTDTAFDELCQKLHEEPTSV
jgi:hypothetical protein